MTVYQGSKEESKTRQRKGIFDHEPLVHIRYWQECDMLENIRVCLPYVKNSEVDQPGANISRERVSGEENREAKCVRFKEW